MKNSKKVISVALSLLFPVIACGVASGCSKKEKEEDTPIVAPSPTQAPTAAAVAPDDDAGAPPIADAGVAPTRPAFTGPASGTIGKCCNALKGNAASAPPEQKVFYAGAAAVCEAARANPNAQQAFAQVRAALRGAKLPPACK